MNGFTCTIVQGHEVHLAAYGQSQEARRALLRQTQDLHEEHRFVLGENWILVGPEENIDTVLENLEVRGNPTEDVPFDDDERAELSYLAWEEDRLTCMNYLSTRIADPSLEDADGSTMGETVALLRDRMQERSEEMGETFEPISLVGDDIRGTCEILIG